MEPPAVQMTGISKSFFGTPVVRSVDLTVQRRQVHALLGENGAGKSVLCSILAGLYAADAGEVRVDGRLVRFRSPLDALAEQVGMVYQDFRLVDSMTVAENVVLGDSRLPRRIPWSELQEEVAAAAADHDLAVDPTAFVGDLTVGERQRVEILKLLYRDVRVLILDEPTSVLTPGEARDLFRTVQSLRTSGRAVIFISHKFAEVRECAEVVTVMRHGQRVGTHRVDSVDDAALGYMMVGRTVSRTAKKKAVSGDADVVLEVRDLSVSDHAGVTAVESLDLTIRRGEILGIAGIAGNGQRELAEAIVGMRSPLRGSIRLNRDGENIAGSSVRRRIELGVAHVPEDRRGVGVAPGLDVGKNLALKSYWRAPISRRGMVSRTAIRRLEESLRATYDIRGGDSGRPISVLSGGNIQKVVLAREFSDAPKVIVAAYPTRGLDLGAVAHVRDSLVRQCEEGCAVLLISEDLDELFELSDRILVVRRGVVRGEFARRDFDAEAIGALMGGADGPKSAA